MRVAKPLILYWETNIGFWGMDLAQRIVTDHQIPVCIINGAVGGTRIDQHQANPAGHTVAGGLYSIYANLLNRVIAAKLTHGIRGVFWHQGESDCSNFGPISDYDYTAYEQNFINMSVAWKQDYPNLQRYIIYQVMPKTLQHRPQRRSTPRGPAHPAPPVFEDEHPQHLGHRGLRGLPFQCHRLREHGEPHGSGGQPGFLRVAYGGPVTAPNLKRAYFTSSARTAIALEFDQAMSWSSFSLPNWYVDDVGGLVTSGSASGNIVTLQLSSALRPNRHPRLSEGRPHGHLPRACRHCSTGPTASPRSLSPTCPSNCSLPTNHGPVRKTSLVPLPTAMPTRILMA